jgi:cobalamin-dependent methionine synthase I
MIDSSKWSVIEGQACAAMGKAVVTISMKAWTVQAQAAAHYGAAAW